MSIKLFREKGTCYTIQRASTGYISILRCGVNGKCVSNFLCSRTRNIRTTQEIEILDAAINTYVYNK